ncbi:hypothetical protein THRCLA_20628 [Thraustotheca clavata]|uniref:Uncharacterized protein n=1 Tax=Thraustotheca clavata TaxID=74557 RepID=A0A1W0A538_9STRA|nr:hypothetical protein THRCLA_20628 [Thraustotheca clavata]
MKVFVSKQCGHANLKTTDIFHTDNINFAHEIIFAMASPLTLGLNGIPIGNRDNALEKIWIDVFKCEWEGEFSVLPRGYLSSNMKIFHYVKTR